MSLERGLMDEEKRPAQEPEEKAKEQEELAVWFEDRKYSGLLDE